MTLSIRRPATIGSRPGEAFRVRRPVRSGSTERSPFAVGLISCLLFLCGLAAPANASKESKLLSARGLVEFNRDQYSRALELFNEAVRSDPSDLDALYYRASTEAKLGDYEAAIVDLRQVVAARPNLPQANLDLGVSLVQTGRYDEALPWLEKAQSTPEIAQRASMFLGIAQLRLGESATASESFRRAASDPDLEITARYYLGVAAYQGGDWNKAQEHFTYVAEQQPNTAVGREAETFLENLGDRLARNYSIYGSTGFQYDSNVILAPSGAGGDAQDVLGVSQQADGRAIVNFGGRYYPWRNSNAEVSVGYDFYQSLHFELNEFNIQDNGPNAQIAGRLGRFRAGLYGRYDYYLLEDQSFLQQVTAWPWVSAMEGSFGRTDLYYRFRDRDYKKQRYALRDAFHHLVGIQQLFYLGNQNRFATLGYEFALEDPDIDDGLVAEGVFTRDEAEAFGYTGHRATAGLGAHLPLELEAELRFWFQNRRYASESREFDEDEQRRRDMEYFVVLTFTRPLLAWLDVTAAFLADINNSNSMPFDYDRYIGSLTIQAHY